MVDECSQSGTVDSANGPQLPCLLELLDRKVKEYHGKAEEIKKAQAIPRLQELSKIASAAEVPQSPHFNLLKATSQPNGKSRELRLYLKVSSSRKFDSNRYICREKEGVPLIQINPCLYCDPSILSSGKMGAAMNSNRRVNSKRMRSGSTHAGE